MNERAKRAYEAYSHIAGPLDYPAWELLGNVEQAGWLKVVRLGFFGKDVTFPATGCEACSLKRRRIMSQNATRRRKVRGATS